MVKEEKSPFTYGGILKALKRFFRDFMGMGHVVDGFRFPGRVIKPMWVPSKEEIRRFYDALQTVMARALFLVYASSGLRKSEVLGLRVADVDFGERMLKPRYRPNSSKNVWISFYNEEAEEMLNLYLEERGEVKPADKLFLISDRQFRKIWREAYEKTGVKITPQVLREWFCCEMAELGVPDRYVDAFCGRVPKSILARHYTDYSPKKLKRIYDKAGLKVLC